MDQRDTIEAIADSKWKGLLRLGGWSGLIIAVLFLREMIIYIASAAPSLADAAGWLMLFQKNRLLALVDFGILEFWGLVLFVPMFLALYVGLRRANESSMADGAVLAVMGIAINFATSQLFPLLSISGLYAAAATDAQRSQFLATAQAALAQSAQGGIGGGVQGGIPLAVAGLIISAVMLRSRTFGKVTAYMGLLANAAGLMMYVSAAFVTAPEGSPFFGPFFLFSVVWFFLVGRRLLQLSGMLG
jgi:hypothetical protein